MLTLHLEVFVSTIVFKRLGRIACRTCLKIHVKIVERTMRTNLMETLMKQVKGLTHPDIKSLNNKVLKLFSQEKPPESTPDQCEMTLQEWICT